MILYYQPTVDFLFCQSKANGDQNLNYDYSPGIAQIMAKSSQQNVFEMATFFITHICHMKFFFAVG